MKKLGLFALLLALLGTSGLRAEATDPHLASLCAAYLTGRDEAGHRLSVGQAQAALDRSSSTLRGHPASRKTTSVWQTIADYFGVIEVGAVDVNLQLESEAFPNVDPERARDVRTSLLQLERLHADLHQWADHISPLRHELRGREKIARYLEGRIRAARRSHLALLRAQAERTDRFDAHLQTLEEVRLRDLDAWTKRRVPGSRWEKIFGPNSIFTTEQRLPVLAGYAAFAAGVTSVVNWLAPGTAPLMSAAVFSAGWFAVRQHVYSAVERLQIGWRAFFQREEDLYQLDRLKSLETSGVRATAQIANMRDMIAFMDRPVEASAMVYHSFSADLPVTAKKKFGRDPELSGERILEGLVSDEASLADGRVVQLHHVLHFEHGEPVLLTFLLERKNTAAVDLYMSMGYF